MISELEWNFDIASSPGYAQEEFRMGEFDRAMKDDVWSILSKELKGQIREAYRAISTAQSCKKTLETARWGNDRAEATNLVVTSKIEAKPKIQIALAELIKLYPEQTFVEVLADMMKAPNTQIINTPTLQTSSLSLKTEVLTTRNSDTNLHYKEINNSPNTEPYYSWDMSLEVLLIPKGQSFEIINHHCKAWFEIPGLIPKTELTDVYFCKPQFSDDSSSLISNYHSSEFLSVYRAGKCAIQATGTTPIIQANFENTEAELTVMLVPVGYSDSIIIRATIPYHNREGCKGWHFYQTKTK